MAARVVSDLERQELSARLHAEVRTEIDRSGPTTDDRFDELALEIARYQLAHVEPLARLARAKGIQANELASIEELPAVPSDVFRLRRVAAHPASEDARVFRTSGTTAGARGEHFYRDLGTYERAAMAQAARWLWPDGPPARVIALAPSSREVPDSSLGFMIDLFAGELDVPISHHIGVATGLDVDGLAGVIEAASKNGEPTLVAGTAFAYVFLADALGSRSLALPGASTVMLTGGFKGRSREVPEAELRSLLAARFDIDAGRIVGEYGMTELSSQLYEARLTGEGALYRAPPWTRIVAVDPVTLAPVDEGEIGIARIVDLANVDSAIAIQTMDRVRVSAQGVELLGRLPGATARGCSLAIEEIITEAR
jgi:hypothetical protein